FRTYSSLNLALDQRTLIDEVQHLRRSIDGDEDWLAFLVQNGLAVLVHLRFGDLVATPRYIARDRADRWGQNAVLNLSQGPDAGNDTGGLGGRDLGNDA